MDNWAKIKGHNNKTHLSIKITSLNVRGLRNTLKRNRVLRHMKDNYPGILFLQETYAVQNDELLWKKQWHREIRMSHSTNHSKRVPILIPQDIDFTINDLDIDTKGCYIIANGSYAGKDLCLMNYYAPTKSDAAQQLAYLDILILNINELP